MRSSNPVSELAARIDACAECGAALPLCRRASGQPLRDWYCAQCGCHYHAALMPKYRPDDLRDVRPARLKMGAEWLSPPPPEVAQFVRQNVPQLLQSIEKRAAIRHPVIRAVAVLPLDQALVPSGPAVMMTSRDISTRGIGLLHDQPVQAPYLLVELSPAQARPVQVITHVIRCRPRGPYYDIAGEFLTKAFDE